MLKEIKRIREDYLITDLEIKKDRIKTNIEQLYKILSTDAVYQIIDEHGVKFSNMKSSPYYNCLIN